MTTSFGLSFLPDAVPARHSPAQYFDIALNLARMADESGLSTIKMTEHYLHPYGGYCPNPVVFLASVAALTKRIRLMTGCILPAFHNPIQMAAETAMLDALSNGRLDVGFARAYLPYEFRAFGVPLDDSREIFFERVSRVIELWKGNLSHLDLGNHDEQKFMALPPPTQVPHPPVWAAAVLSPQSFAAIGEQGFNLLVSSGLADLAKIEEHIGIFRAAAGDQKSFVAISIPLVIRKTHSLALAAARTQIQCYLKVWADAASSWKYVKSSAYPSYGNLAQQISSVSVDSLLQNRNVVAGDTHAVIDQTKEIVSRLKVDQVLWHIDFGSADREAMVETLSLFINKVLPQVG
jgi:alkanesulfonate monooxygenase SsuD/methylene tetrahydromethanopterin reductase-like flavin-dependent oxidoreductase (luciferase family)